MKVLYTRINEHTYIHIYNLVIGLLKLQVKRDVAILKASSVPHSGVLFAILPIVSIGLTKYILKVLYGIPRKGITVETLGTIILP